MTTDLAHTVELHAAVHLTAIGLSHILQPKAWADFFVLVRAHGTTGAFAIAFLALMFGSVIVAFHNVWEGGAIVLTLFGWAQIVKASVYFLAPEVGVRSMGRVSLNRLWYFQVGGAGLLLMAAWLVFRLSQGS